MNGKKWVRLSAAAWVDASNDGDTAAKAGSGYFLGREQANSDRAMQSAGLFFKLRKVNWDKIRAYTKTQRHLSLAEALRQMPTIRVASDARVRGNRVTLVRGGGIGPYAWERGDIVKGYRPHGQNIEIMSINFGQTAPDEAILNTLNILGVNGLTKFSRMRGRKEAMEELPLLLPFLRKKMPGLENAELVGGDAAAGLLAPVPIILGDWARPHPAGARRGAGRSDRRGAWVGSLGGVGGNKRSPALKSSIGTPLSPTAPRLRVEPSACDAQPWPIEERADRPLHRRGHHRAVLRTT